MRDYHVLSYAEYLRSDSGLWRIMADYMYSCNEIGKHQADEILGRYYNIHQLKDGVRTYQVTRAYRRLPAFPCFWSLLPLRPLCPPSHLLLSWRRTSPLIEGKTFVGSYVQCVEIWSTVPVPPQLPLMMEMRPLLLLPDSQWWDSVTNKQS